MKYQLLSFLFLAILWSCKNPSEEKLEKSHTVKAIDFQEFKVISISPQAKTDLHNWKSFQSLLQIIVNMAPTKVKNTEDLVATKLDSLLIYKRLYPLNQKTFFENAIAERDWRMANNSKDTVFRLEKREEGEFSFMEWNHFLIENTPYVFSFFVKKINLEQLKISFVSEDKEFKHSQYNLADSTLTQKSHITAMNDGWFEIKEEFIPSKSSTYGIRMDLTENSKKGDNVIFYRPTLQILAKDLQKVRNFSDKIVQEHSFVESSYYSVFFWLKQIDDELKHLLNEDTFPEKLNVPTIKSRFQLLHTQIKELADNVKNNPDYQEVIVEKSIQKIEKTFNSILLRINYIYESDLDEKMQQINNQIDSNGEFILSNL